MGRCEPEHFSRKFAEISSFNLASISKIQKIRSKRSNHLEYDSNYVKFQ